MEEHNKDQDRRLDKVERHIETTNRLLRYKLT